MNGYEFEYLLRKETEVRTVYRAALKRASERTPTWNRHIATREAAEWEC